MTALQMKIRFRFHLVKKCDNSTMKKHMTELVIAKVYVSRRLVNFFDLDHGVRAKICEPELPRRLAIDVLRFHILFGL